jgi:predicted nucleotidyltransferase
MNLILEKASAINKLCEKHKVKRLYAFGSVLTDSFNAESDVDFLVDFKAGKIEKYLRNYFSFKENLQKLLSRDIDLIENDSISNPYFKEEIEETKKLVYESKSK